MLENIDRKRAKIWIKMAIIILATLVLILSLFRLFLYNSNQRKLISEFKNTKIREKMCIRDRVFSTDLLLKSFSLVRQANYIQTHQTD